jgi:hypothetical protein
LARLAENPYRWDRTNPDLFYGRGTLVDEMCRGLLRGSSYGLTGGTRMGKTTLLRRLEKHLSSERLGRDQAGLDVVVVYMDLHALPEPLSADVIFDAILKRVSARLPTRGVASQPVPLHPFAAALSDHIAGASTKPVVLVLFDEIKKLVDAEWGPGFLANWRAFLHNEPALDRHLAAAFAGSTDLEALRHDLGSPLANILTWKGLRLFEREDTAALVREPSGLGAGATDDDVDLVHDQSGGHPFLVQWLMSRVMDRLPAPMSVAIADASREFGSTHGDKLRDWWDRFDATSRRLYAALEGSEDGLEREATLGLVGSGRGDRAIESLCHTGVAREVSGRVRWAGRIFRAWFDAHGRHDLLPPDEMELLQLLRRLEGQLRERLHSHLEARLGPTWLACLEATRPTVVAGWRRNARGALAPGTALQYSNLGDLFELVFAEWPHFKGLFTLSSDATQSRVRLDERRQVRVAVRNDLMHSRPVDPIASRKAAAFALELLSIMTA